MQSPIASFFTPAFAASVPPGQKTGSVMPGIPQNGSAAIAGTGTERESFFDLLMMVGIEKDSSAATLLDAAGTDQAEKSAITSDPNFLTSGLPLSVLNDAQIESTGQFQLMTDLLSNAHHSLPTNLVAVPIEITQERMNQTLLHASRVNSMPQSSVLQAGGSIDQIGRGNAPLDMSVHFDTSLSTVSKPSSIGTRELSQQSFFSIQKQPAATSHYSLKIDPQLTPFANPQNTDSNSTLAQLTEQLLGLTNTFSVQLTQDAQVLNQTASHLNPSELISVTSTAAVHANPHSGIIAPVAQKTGSNKTTVQQDQKTVTNQTTTVQSTANTLSLDSETDAGNNLADNESNSADKSIELLDAEESLENLESKVQNESANFNTKSNETSNTASNLNGQLQSELQVRSNDADATTKVDQVRFILPNLTHATSKNGTSIVIDLEPRSLGAAELRLTVRNEVVHAELRVNSQEAKQAVEANLDQLQKSFDRAGITVSKVDVSLNNQGDARQFAQQQGWHTPKFKFNQHRFTLDESLDSVQSIATQPLFSASTLIRPQPGRSWTA